MTNQNEMDLIPDDLTQEELLSLNEILLNTREQCQMTAQLIENQLKRKDQLIDRLHQELETYKQDQPARLVEQAMKELIGLWGRLLKRQSSPQWAELDAEKLREEFTYLDEDILDLLERQNIEPFTTQPGQPFDGGRHRAMNVVSADSPELDRRVKASLAPGYAKGDKVLIPEHVTVYRFQ